MKPQKKGFSPELKVFNNLQNVAHRFMEFHHSYTHFFDVHKRSVKDCAKKYLAGLLMKSNRKNIERIDEYVEGGSYEASQYFISESLWNYKSLNKQILSDINTYLGGKESVLCLDESAFSKKGKKSAGVGRQWNGRLGKNDNCQVGVFSSLCDGSRSSIVDYRLYLPKEWTDDKERCAMAKIPTEHCVFKTKLELALEMVDDVHNQGLNFGWIAADAFYGRDSKLLKALDDRKLNFVVDISCNRTVYLDDPQPYLPRRKTKVGRKSQRLKSHIEPISVEKVFQQVSKYEWTDIRLRDTTKGVLKVRASRKRIYLWDGTEKQAQRWWLVMLHDTQTNEKKWFLSNAKKSVTLTKLVEKHSFRYWIERTFQDGKTSVGMADYQVRGWLGWQHHMSMVMMALFFLLKERDINKKDFDLLSCQDIVELLNFYLPRKDCTEEAVLKNMVTRHIKRKKSIESAYRRQKFKEVNLTK